MMGLCGPQGSGKTTLARAYAKKHDVPFVQTNATQVFVENGLDPAKTYDFETRLNIQEKILTRFVEAYRNAPLNGITDRTPIDMMAYTLSECPNEGFSKEVEIRLEKYLNRCFEALNCWFSAIVVVQPGILLVPREGKAGTSKAHVEHISSLVLGLSVDERIKPAHFYLPRGMTNMNDRVAALEFALDRAQKRIKEEMEGVSLH